MYNNCSFIGNIGKDPELKTGQTGTAFCNFTIAVNKGSGEQKETMWLNVTAFGKTAEFVGQRLKKGSLVLVNGELKIEEYVDKEAAKRMSVKILAGRVVPLSRTEGTTATTEQTAAAGVTSSVGISQDDIPF